ncbi:MAG: SH3 domain-containing protein [Saprospiraceae bacterium]|nr:SH3 domain-containing protein [Saprospiraceae bacterium]MCB9318927.1 SH3 domain-containing protein [Lewinellaceae bacterium]
MPTKVFLNLIVIATLIAGCKQNNQDTTDVSTPVTDTVPAKPEKIEFKVLVDKLRLRDKPSQKGQVIDILAEGTLLEYLHDSTDYEETITLRNTPYTKPWYKVDYPRLDTVGWVFGGAVSKVSTNTTSGMVALKPGRLVHKLENADIVNLSQILEIELPRSNYLFNGFYEYRQNEQGGRILDGSFRIATEYVNDDNNEDVKMSLEGRYEAGKKDGAFVYKFEFPTAIYTTTLYYEKDSDKCLWGSVIGTGTDSPVSYREENPESCTLNYLNRKAGIFEWK